MTFSTNKYQSTALRLCKIEVANKKRGHLFALTSNTKVRRNEKCRLKNAIVLILIASLLLLLTKNQSPSLWFQWKVALSTFQSSWSCLYPSADDQSLLRSSRVTALIYWVCLFLESSDGLDLLGTTTRSSFQYQASHYSSFLSDDDHRSLEGAWVGQQILPEAVKSF